MSLTQIAVIIAGAWLILIGAGSEITNTVTLIMGIAVVILVVMDSASFRAYRTQNRP
jgi:hypothetical protein